MIQIRTTTCAIRSQPDKRKTLRTVLGDEKECSALNPAEAHNLIQDTFRLCGNYAWMPHTDTLFGHLRS